MYDSIVSRITLCSVLRTERSCRGTLCLNGGGGVYIKRPPSLDTISARIRAAFQAGLPYNTVSYVHGILPTRHLIPRCTAALNKLNVAKSRWRHCQRFLLLFNGVVLVCHEFLHRTTLTESHWDKGECGRTC